MEIRILTENDLSILEDLATKLPNMWGVPKDKNFNKLMIESFYHKNKIFVGCLVDNELYSVMASYYWSEMNITTISSIMINPTLSENPIARIKESKIGLVCDKILEHNQQKGFWQFYVSMPEKYYDVWDKIWKKESKEHLKYNIFKEECIKKNTFSKYKWSNYLILNKLWPFNVIIRHGVLQNEYRSL